MKYEYKFSIKERSTGNTIKSNIPVPDLQIELDLAVQSLRERNIHFSQAYYLVVLDNILVEDDSDGTSGLL